MHRPNSISNHLHPILSIGVSVYPPHTHTHTHTGLSDIRTLISHTYVCSKSSGRRDSLVMLSHYHNGSCKVHRQAWNSSCILSFSPHPVCLSCLLLYVSSLFLPLAFFFLISFHLHSVSQSVLSFLHFSLLFKMFFFYFHLLRSSSYQFCFLFHSFYLYSSPFTCCGFFPLFHFSLCCLFFFRLYFLLSISHPPSVAVKYQSGGFIPSIRE